MSQILERFSLIEHETTPHHLQFIQESKPTDRFKKFTRQAKDRIHDYISSWKIDNSLMPSRLDESNPDSQFPEPKSSDDPQFASFSPRESIPNRDPALDFLKQASVIFQGYEPIQTKLTASQRRNARLLFQQATDYSDPIEILDQAKQLSNNASIPWDLLKKSFHGQLNYQKKLQVLKDANLPHENLSIDQLNKSLKQLQSRESAIRDRANSHRNNFTSANLKQKIFQIENHFISKFKHNRQAIRAVALASLATFALGSCFPSNSNNRNDYDSARSTPPRSVPVNPQDNPFASIAERLDNFHLSETEYNNSQTHTQHEIDNISNQLHDLKTEFNDQFAQIPPKTVVIQLSSTHQDTQVRSPILAPYITPETSSPDLNHRQELDSSQSFFGLNSPRVDRGAPPLTITPQLSYPHLKNTPTTNVNNPEVKAVNPMPAHIVQKGETLSELTRIFYGKNNTHLYRQVAQYNNISNPDLIYPGQIIFFPISISS